MRENHKSLTRASKDNGISPKTVRQSYDVFERVNNKWRPGLTDRMPPTPFKFYENGRETRVIVNSRRVAAYIGHYFNGVRRYLDKGDDSVLMQFKNRAIPDATRHAHVFETRLTIVERIDKSREDPEFYDIYDY
jgi:hypothetical protein